MEMNNEIKKVFNKILSDEKVKKSIEEDKWGDVIKYVTNNIPSIDIVGVFIDTLIKAGINFCPYMDNVPDYAFYGSTLLKEANLKEIKSIGSRAFRKSNIERIILSKNNLKDLGVGIISGVKNEVTIIWDGTYAEWVKIRRNSNCWYNYTGIINIKCTDGIFHETNSNG